MNSILEISQVSKSFGGLQVLRAVGAGKTTLFETIFGFIHPVQGSIRFQGNDIQQCIC